MDKNMGKILITTGAIIIMIGIVILFKDQIPGIRHLGRLPGDIVIQRKNFAFYFPIVTCIVISIVLTIVFYLFNKLR